MVLDVVTGATGHVGNVLVRELISRGRNVRVVLQPGEDRSPLCGIHVQLFEAGLGDRTVLRAAFAGADRVFHLAARVGLGHSNLAQFHATNVDGTRAVLDACRYAHVRRLVHLGAAQALVEPRDGVLDEAAGFDPTRVTGPCARATAKACALVREAARSDAGPDAVLVLPTDVVGPMDWALSDVGQLLLELEHRHVRFLLPGSADFVDVRDVARGLVAAAEQGRRGEAYLLGGERLTLSDIAELVREETGAPVPRMVPTWAARSLAAPAPLVEAVTHRRTLFTPEAVRELSATYVVSHARATAELGFVPGSVRKAFRDALDWHHSHPARRVLQRVG